MREENIHVGLPSDGPFDIGCSVNIVCMDRLPREDIARESLETHIDKVSSGTTVNEGSGFDNLSSSS